MIETAHRRIVTPIPAPQSRSVLEKLQRYEPRALDVLPPVVWDRAEGYQVYDASGNCWIDFTSGIYVANVGHAHPDVCDALSKQIDGKLLHAYLYATEPRARLVEKLAAVSPTNLTKVFLASTGSEAVEVALKLARLNGLAIDPNKTVLVSHQGAFHGRTMGSQQLTSALDQKEWIVNPDPDFCQIPFPTEQDGRKAFAGALDGLRANGFNPERIAAFVVEGYQAMGGPMFFPDDYIQAMRQWANSHQALVVFDEIQSGFGRTGKFFAYEHYGVEADLVCCGKGISSSLPLSAVLGRGEIMDFPPPGYMTSTHTGNPMGCAAALATLEVIERENLVAAAEDKGKIFQQQLIQIQRRYPDRITHVLGRGMVHALIFVVPGRAEPDVALAKRIIDSAIENGVMLLYTHGSGSVKMGPPLMTPEDGLVEGLNVLAEAVEACVEEAQARTR